MKIIARITKTPQGAYAFNGRAYDSFVEARRDMLNASRSRRHARIENKFLSYQGHSAVSQTQIVHKRIYQRIDAQGGSK